MTTSSPRTAVYTRISLDQAGLRAGVERQRRECHDLAERKGWDVVAEFEDNSRSAYSGKPRPAFEELIERAQSGEFDRLVVWSSDRLYRRMADLTRITGELAPHLSICTVMGGEVDLESAEGIMRAQVLGSVAEFESRRRGERIRAAARQRAEKGVVNASVRPFGWAWMHPCPGGEDCRHVVLCPGGGDCEHAPSCNAGQRDVLAATSPPRCEVGQTRLAEKGASKRLRPDPAEAPVLRECYQRVADGESLHSVCRWLSRSGVRGVTGSTFVPTTLKVALTNPRHAGIATLRGAAVGKLVEKEVIVEQELWDRVNEVLSSPGRDVSLKARGSRAVLLSSLLIRCGVCGEGMAGGRNAAKARVYRCRDSHGLHRRVELVDGPVLELARRLLTTLEADGLLVLPAAEEPSTAPTRARLRELEDRLGDLSALVASGDLDTRDYASAAKRIRAEIEALTPRLRRRKARTALAKLADTPGGAGAAFDALVAMGRAGDPLPLNTLLAEVVQRAVVLPSAVPLHPHESDLRIDWQPWVPEGAATSLPAPERTPLTRAERRKVVAKLLSDGWGTEDIAAQLGVTGQTVRLDRRALNASP